MVYSTRDVVHAGRLADEPCGGLLDVVGKSMPAASVIRPRI